MLYVLKGASVTFKAVPNPPTAAWPAGRPVWSGTSGATGSGPTVTVAFNTTSSSTTDFKTVVATSGNAVQVSAEKAKYYDRQPVLRFIAGSFPKAAEGYIVEAYSKPPFVPGELEQLPDTCLPGHSVNKRITESVSKTRQPPAQYLERAGRCDSAWRPQPAEDVRGAPDSVLFEMMGLDPNQGPGWLEFIVRELGWHSMIAANWGLPVLKIPDGVTYDTTTVEQRRAQAVAYYLELMRERGRDPLAEARTFAEQAKAGFRGRRGRDVGGAVLARWLERRHPWLYFIYAYGGKPNPAHLLTAPASPNMLATTGRNSSPRYGRPPPGGVATGTRRTRQTAYSGSGSGSIGSAWSASAPISSTF